MTVACEALQTKASSQKGWQQWGYLGEGGEWVGLYGLKDSLNDQESMYYLDAAGVCEAVGQSGQPAIAEDPAPAIAGITPASVALPQTSTEVVQPASDSTPWGLLLIALIALGFIAWKRGFRMFRMDSIFNSEPIVGQEKDYPNVFGGTSDD